MKQPGSKAEFAELVSNIEERAGYIKPIAFGIALTEFSNLSSEVPREVAFLAANFRENYGAAAIIGNALQRADSVLVSPMFMQVDYMLDFFTPFIGESGHPNIEALQKAREVLQINKHSRPEKRVWIIFLREEHALTHSPLVRVFWQHLLEKGKISALPKWHVA